MYSESRAVALLTRKSLVQSASYRFQYMVPPAVVQPVIEHAGLRCLMISTKGLLSLCAVSLSFDTSSLAHVMRPSKRDEVSGLLQSTWSALSSRSRRAAASAESLWKQVNTGSPGPSPEYLYLMPGWAVKRREASVSKRAATDEGQSDTYARAAS